MIVFRFSNSIFWFGIYCSWVIVVYFRFTKKLAQVEDNVSLWRKFTSSKKNRNDSRQHLLDQDHNQPLKLLPKFLKASHPDSTSDTDISRSIDCWCGYYLGYCYCYLGHCYSDCLKKFKLESSSSCYLHVLRNIGLGMIQSCFIQWYILVLFQNQTSLIIGLLFCKKASERRSPDR